MKSMFQVGFTQDLFGARLPSPAFGKMLGQVALRGSGSANGSRGLGQSQITTDGDALLRQLQMAENQVAAANSYIAKHPNLQQDLGADFPAFQRNMAVISDAASVETTFMMELQSTPPGQQYSTTESDYNTVQAYIAAAAAVALAASAHPNVSPAAGSMPTTPGAPKTVAVTPKNDLTTPLLVGGGILTIGLVALLARA